MSHTPCKKADKNVAEPCHRLEVWSLSGASVPDQAPDSPWVEGSASSHVRDIVTECKKASIGNADHGNYKKTDLQFSRIFLVCISCPDMTVYYAHFKINSIKFDAHILRTVSTSLSNAVCKIPR